MSDAGVRILVKPRGYVTVKTNFIYFLGSYNCLFTVLQIVLYCSSGFPMTHLHSSYHHQRNHLVLFPFGERGYNIPSLSIKFSLCYFWQSLSFVQMEGSSKKRKTKTKNQLWHGVPFMCAFFWFHWCSKLHKR